MRIFIAAVALSFAFAFTTTQFSDAPTGFDNKTNGMVDDATHQADQTKFDETEQLSDGVGPLYNAVRVGNSTQKHPRLQSDHPLASESQPPSSNRLAGNMQQVAANQVE